MNNTIALDSHAEATEHRPISPIEHDRVTAAAAAHDALAIGEPLLIVAGGPAAVRAELCRALTVDRLAVGEDVLVLATRTDGAVPEGSVAAYLGLRADAPDDALADALTQYATAETRLVLILTNAERLDEGGVTVIRRLREADPVAKALSVVLLGDDTVGLVGDRLLRPAPPGGLRFIRLTPLALTPAAPVAALPAGPPIAPPVPAPPVLAPAPVAEPVDPPVAAQSAAPWAAETPTEALADATIPPHDDAAHWDAAPDRAAFASADAVMAHDHEAHDQAADNYEAHDHGAHDQAVHGHEVHGHEAYHEEAYEEGADGAADLAVEDEPVDVYEEPEAERDVPYWERLPERPPTPAPAPVQGPLDQVPATRDWHSFQDTPAPAPPTSPVRAPVEPEYTPQVVAAAPAPSAPPKEAGRDKDWGTLKAAAQTGRYPPAAEGEAGAYAPADAASYTDAFAQLAAQEARVVQPPRTGPQPMLRRAQVLAGGDDGAVDEDGMPLEIRGSRTRMILPFAGIAVLAALIGWFVVRAVVGGGHATPQGLQIALSKASPDPLVATPAPSTAALSTTAPKDAPPPLPPDMPAASGKAGAPGPAEAAPPGAVPPTGSATAAAMAAPPSQPLTSAHADPGPPVKPDAAPGAAREAAAEHGRTQALAAVVPAMPEAAGTAAHPPTIPATAGPPPPAHPAPQHPAPEQQAIAPPVPPPTAVPQAPMAAPVLPPGPGLLVIAKAEDTLQSLYSRVYKGLQAPPFEVVEAMNPHEIKLGDVVVFPAPPGGWHRLPNTAGR
jgi:hypothetical protein